ncbi:MAG: LytTR family transcriptional regulator DNA-binding domain-containing protein [bacterium]|nr:LytTR family transcriptional regulator DNA-binding domain-containing protein [bacterium]
MINFIICDDNKEFLIREKKIIDNLMMKYDIEYECKMFTNYGNDFQNFMKEEKGFKIYLLDIQIDEISGLDAARIIREEYDDWTSVIILVTAYNEFKYEALTNRLYLLDFINKLNNYEENLKEDIHRALKNYNNREKTLKFEYNHVLKTVEYRHIVYIEKELDSKRCIINTIYGNMIIPKTLTEVYKMLDERFIKTSRSMIINSDYIEQYNYKENKITFINGETTYQISRGMKKGIKDYVEHNK